LKEQVMNRIPPALQAAADGKLRQPALRHLSYTPQHG
jgi:hypothetical protein